MKCMYCEDSGELPGPSEKAKRLARVIYTAWMHDDRFLNPALSPPTAYFWAEVAAKSIIDTERN